MKKRLVSLFRSGSFDEEHASDEEAATWKSST
jgi:hypothetical protein